MLLGGRLVPAVVPAPVPLDLDVAVGKFGHLDTRAKPACVDVSFAADATGSLCVVRTTEPAVVVIDVDGLAVPGDLPDVRTALAAR